MYVNIFGEMSLLTDEERLQIEIDYLKGTIIPSYNRMIDSYLDMMNQFSDDIIQTDCKTNLSNLNAKRDAAKEMLETKQSLLIFVRGSNHRA